MLSSTSVFIAMVNLIAMTSGDLRFTNIKCTAFDPPFADFGQCDLKILRRGVVGLNLWVRLHQVPVSNVSVNLSLHKKANGYRPFMYNVSVDFCKFSSNRARYPFYKLVFDALIKDSNINHTCPYDHDIIVHNWVLQTEYFRLLPLPSGEYVFVLKVAAFNEWKADVKFYLYINELK